MMDGTDLRGQRILVVEDDLILASVLCDDLREHGATVLGPAPTPFYALSLLGRRGVDGAVLDVRLHGSTVFEVADELLDRHIPFVFATASTSDALPEKYRHMTVVNKPYETTDVVTALNDAARLDRGGKAIPAVPMIEVGAEAEVSLRIAAASARSMRL